MELQGGGSKSVHKSSPAAGGDGPAGGGDPEVVLTTFS